MHKKMGRGTKNNRIKVTEDNVADVVSMMTGIPVNELHKQKVIN